MAPTSTKASSMASSKSPFSFFPSVVHFYPPCSFTGPLVSPTFSAESSDSVEAPFKGSVDHHSRSGLGPRMMMFSISEACGCRTSLEPDHGGGPMFQPASTSKSARSSSPTSADSWCQSWSLEGTLKFGHTNVLPCIPCIWRSYGSTLRVV